MSTKWFMDEHKMNHQHSMAQRTVDMPVNRIQQTTCTTKHSLNTFLSHSASATSFNRYGSH